MTTDRRRRSARPGQSGDPGRQPAQVHGLRIELFAQPFLELAMAPVAGVLDRLQELGIAEGPPTSSGGRQPVGVDQVRIRRSILTVCTQSSPKSQVCFRVLVPASSHGLRIAGPSVARIPAREAGAICAGDPPCFPSTSAEKQTPARTHKNSSGQSGAGGLNPIPVCSIIVPVAGRPRQRQVVFSWIAAGVARRRPVSRISRTGAS